MQSYQPTIARQWPRETERYASTDKASKPDPEFFARKDPRRMACQGRRMIACATNEYRDACHSMRTFVVVWGICDSGANVIFVIDPCFLCKTFSKRSH